MDAAQYHQFVPAEPARTQRDSALTKHTKVQKKSKPALSKRQKRVTMLNNAIELIERVREERVREERARKERDRKIMDITAFLQHIWQSAKKKNADTWLRRLFVPTAYRFVSILCVSKDISYGTCWNMANLVESSMGFDENDTSWSVKATIELLNSTCFEVYAPTRYDSMSCRDIPVDDAWIRGMVKDTFTPVKLFRRMPPISMFGTETSEFLGKGAYGDVSRIVRGDKIFARKTIRGQSVWHLLDAGVREIALLLQLRGAKHIVNIHEKSPRILSRDRIQFDMELGKGALSIRLGQTQDLHILHKFLVDIATGIQECHNLQIMHRDLKPENILLFEQPDGTTVAKLADFGLARRKSQCEDRAYTSQVVTSWYRAPELWRARLDRKYYATYGLGVDVFSFGIIVCDVLSRQRYIKRIVNPVPEDTSTAWWHNFFSSQLQTFISTDTMENIGPYKNIIAQCLRPNPRQRIQISTVLNRLRWVQIKNMISTAISAVKPLLPFELPPHSDIAPPNIKIQRQAALQARF